MDRVVKCEACRNQVSPPLDVLEWIPINIQMPPLRSCELTIRKIPGTYNGGAVRWNTERADPLD